MAKAHQHTATLATYPQDGNFGELLNWHLDWGTRAQCSTEARNKPWVRSHFAQFVHEEGTDIRSAARSLRNWAKHGVLPSEGETDTLSAIFRELFGDDRNLDCWKIDLETALKRGRQAQAARIAKRPVPEPSCVPLPTEHFMGRAEEMEALATLLASSDGPSALLVQGGPGIGKSELTKAVAHHPDVTARFGERRYFVPLDTATTVLDLQKSIVRSIGVDPALGFPAALKTLHERNTLLVLDNLETLWNAHGERQATEQILSILAALPNLWLLASFRGRETVDGTLWHGHELGTLPPSAATELFAAIAGPRSKTDEHIEPMINALGGHPAGHPFGCPTRSRSQVPRAALARMAESRHRTGAACRC